MVCVYLLWDGNDIAIVFYLYIYYGWNVCLKWSCALSQMVMDKYKWMSICCKKSYDNTNEFATVSMIIGRNIKIKFKTGCKYIYYC